MDQKSLLKANVYKVVNEFQKQNIEYLILNKRIIEQHEIVFDVYTPRKNNVQVKKIMKQKNFVRSKNQYNKLTSNHLLKIKIHHHINKKRYFVREKESKVEKIKNCLINIFNNQNICVMGIDGTGKSSAVKRLKDIFGSNTTVQYMGRKEWETNLAQKRNSVMDNGKHPIFKLFGPLIMGIEFYYRVYKHYTTSKVVIFDRYIWEFVLQLVRTNTGISFILKKLVYKVLFSFLYPKPKYCFYLTCDISTSIKRKDDITETELESLQWLKEKNDKAYKHNKNIIVINTDLLNSDEVIKKIIEYLPNQFIKRL